MTTLHGKFFVVVAALVLVTGGLAFFLEARTFQHYTLAMTQALNAQLAPHLVGEYFARLPASTAAAPGVKDDINRIMTANPNIELYILDKDGRIEGFTVPKDAVLRRSIALQPIRDFLSGYSMFPVYGDDPRDLSRQKIFSAAALDPTHPEAGYLYVILGGAEYDSAAGRIQGILLFRSALIVLSAGAAVAMAMAFFVLMTMTRRLRHLATAIEAFRSGGFRYPTAVSTRAAEPGDELDRLGRAFNAMSAHIQTQMKAVAEANAHRRDLIAGVSHDLRTPLASLRGYLETLIMKDQTLSAEDRRTYLNVASRQCDRLSRQVEELFELAKLEELEPRLNIEPFQLSELVQDVLLKFQLLAEQERVTLHGDFMPQAPLVCGDISLIERMLDNLLENAMRHTAPGGRVDVSVTAANSSLKIEVKDTGSGIPAEDVPHIFERFYRVDKSRGAGSGGAGLGLAIASRIVELHAGQIWVQSEVGSGTSFFVELPTL
jgi:two-component system OmpR family sensor kinase